MIESFAMNETRTLLLNGKQVEQRISRLAYQIYEDNAMETVEQMKNCIYAKVPGNHQTMLYGNGAAEIVDIIKHFLDK